MSPNGKPICSETLRPDKQPWEAISLHTIFSNSSEFRQASSKDCGCRGTNSCDTGCSCVTLSANPPLIRAIKSSNDAARSGAEVEASYASAAVIVMAGFLPNCRKSLQLEATPLDGHRQITP